ncbi:MAG: hypothetical protein AB8H86_20990 [Polyangiales bacterium]
MLLALSFVFIASRVSAQCEYQGEATLTVHVPAFQAGLVVDGAVVVRPQRQGAHVEARVGLGFEGTSAGVRYRLVRRVETNHGRVSLGPATHVRELHAHGSGLRFDVRLNHYMELRGLDAPCGAVSLFSPLPESTIEFPYEQGDGTAWTPRTRTLRLFRRAGGGGSYRLRLLFRTVIYLSRTEQHGDWFRVHWTDRYNRFDGWAHRRDLRPTRRMGHGMTGGSGQMGCMRGTVRSIGDHVYQGAARPRPGAFVRESAGGEIWASVRESEGFEVRHINGEAWAQIIIAPGVHEEDICEELRHAWIRADEVTFPVPRDVTPEVDAP